MSRREDIDNAIWSDPDFEDLGPWATLLYLWSWTNPRCGMAGIYKVSLRAMTESKVPTEHLGAALDELSAARFAYYENGVLFVRSRVRHLRQKTDQIAKSIANDVAKIAPAHPLRARFLEEYGGYAFLRDAFAATLTRASGDPQPIPLSKPKNRGSTEGHLTLHGNGNGKGTGKGKGKGTGIEESRARAESAKAWALENIPDLPADFVAQVYSRMPGESPANVRAVVLRAYPTLAENVA